MIILGIILLILGLVLALPILFWIGIVLLVLGIVVNLTHAGGRLWW